MMQKNYEKSLELILVHEGGFVNHPEDPGGITNMGVTKSVYEAWVEKEVTEEDMRNLTEDNVAPIYKKNYWDRCKCDDLASGLDLCVFDFGVNAGTGRSARFLQALVGTVADGAIGPNTIRKVNEYVGQEGLESTIKDFQKHRQEYYEGLKHFETFGKGWTRRVDETTHEALEMMD